MSRLTPVFAAVLLICIMTGIAVAGGTPMTAKGDRQIVFHFNGLSRLHLEPYFRAVGFIDDAINWDCVDDGYYDCNIVDCSPCSGGLGFRYFLNADRAVRLGANIGLGGITFKDPVDDSEVKWSCTEFGLSLIYEKYFMTIHGVAPYAGAGAGFTYSKAKVESDGETTSEVSGNAFDVMGVIGFQWYFTEGMSLGGEYQTGFTYESGNEKEMDEKIGEWTGYAFNHRTASFFLGVHF
jgi:hypothetical protein